MHLSYAGEVRVKGKGKGAFDSVSIQAIYGAIDSYHSRETHTLGGRSCVTRLAISAAAHERALSLVQTKDRRPPPVGSDDDSNDLEPRIIEIEHYF